jgi:riboflavin biosynthesis pyrimidine reductase
MVYIKAFLGASINGYISTGAGNAAKFSDPLVMQNLRRSFNDFEAVVMGGQTLKSYGSTLTAATAKPDQIIYSRSTYFDPELRFFQQKGRKILVSPEAAIEDLATWDSIHLDLFKVLRSYKKVACLGGAQLLKALLAAQMVSEIEISVSPVWFSQGVRLPDFYADLKLLSSEVVGRDIVNTYLLKY